MSFLDLTGVKVQTGDYQLVPSGTYRARIAKATAGDTKAGGRKIDIQLKISAGKHENRVVFASFNYKNASEEAERIGKEQLKTLMSAAGMGDVLESVSDLEGKEVAIKIGQKKGTDAVMRNNVVAYIKPSEAKYTEADAQSASNDGVPW